MSAKGNWGRWLRRFIGFAPDGAWEALDVLCPLYVEESRHAARLSLQAQKMPYPQFRAKLLEMAAEEGRHAGWIAEKIKLLGGSLPNVPQPEPAGRNSWEFLLADLEDHRRCAADLMDDIRILRPRLPAVADMLQRIHDEGAKHREKLREMMMRSDPQALMAA